MFDKAKSWIKKHRKGVIITASIIAIVGGAVILIIKGKKVKMPVAEVAAKMIPEVPSVATAITEEVATVTINVDGVMKTFPRDEFIRQLHEGWRASEAKLVEAAAKGIPLKSGETLVNACIVTMKNVA